FFQAEDGIRDLIVTGVQTCALPISLRRMDEILVANFMVFQEVLDDGLYDLVIGDEAWDVDHFWHENPELKRGNHVWLTDFVGYRSEERRVGKEGRCRWSECP